MRIEESAPSRVFRDVGARLHSWRVNAHAAIGSSHAPSHAFLSAVAMLSKFWSAVQLCRDAKAPGRAFEPRLSIRHPGRPEDLRPAEAILPQRAVPMPPILVVSSAGLAPFWPKSRDMHVVGQAGVHVTDLRVETTCPRGAPRVVFHVSWYTLKAEICSRHTSGALGEQHLLTGRPTSPLLGATPA